jgi:hypothetical protein
MQSRPKKTQSKETLIPVKDRKWVILSLVITLAIAIYGLWSMLHMPSAEWHSRAFNGLFKNYGFLSSILLFAVLASYVFLFILKKRWLDSWSLLKRCITVLLRITRKLHAPLAILVIGMIVLHIVGAFLYGFKLDFYNISGLLAGIMLLPVPIAGLFRYRRLDRNWHLRFGLAFAVLFLIHAYL